MIYLDQLEWVIQLGCHRLQEIEYLIKSSLMKGLILLTFQKDWGR